MLPDERSDVLRPLLATSSDDGNPPPGVVAHLMRTARRVAVVGISRDPAKAARRIPAFLLAKGYEILPVNPVADRILGRPVFRSLAEIPDPVDLVLVFRPSESAGGVITEALGIPGDPAIWLQEGIRSDDLAEQARTQGRTVIQDLCIYKVHQALEDPENAKPAG